MMARAVQISAKGRECASTPATSRDSCAESELTRSEVTDSAGPDTGIRQQVVMRFEPSEVICPCANQTKRAR